MTRAEMRKAVKANKEYHFTEYIREDKRLLMSIDYLYTLNEITLEFISHQLFVIENYADTFGTKVCKEVAESCQEQIRELNRFTENWKKAEGKAAY